jgi:hypothetical protein
VRRGASRLQPLAFVLRSALPVPDGAGGGGGAFLVPDKELGALVRLHDWLYAGGLAPALRLDIPAIPHITVARTTSPRAAKRPADGLNAQPQAIPGRIAALDVVVREEDAVRPSPALPFRDGACRPVYPRTTPTVAATRRSRACCGQVSVPLVALGALGDLGRLAVRFDQQAGQGELNRAIGDRQPTTQPRGGVLTSWDASVRGILTPPAFGGLRWPIAG